MAASIPKIINEYIISGDDIVPYTIYSHAITSEYKNPKYYNVVFDVCFIVGFCDGFHEFFK
ncbi:hypothetical protein KAM472_24830 [Aeromonas caviae]|nr:hypothetical protein KAM462_33140 [Aeromonas caviae]GKR10194.1 hypothetical protein KAM465_17710 [Aeromonas caviae]GKR13839.1 hypothetical protein KAM466_11570 [Aeromonas caviae]GKR17917.1 hypothetical protein KAM467_09610 [Aeromonas caviae]GKR24518.1 hypothetical protein KAM468_32580 [Aeromonas caviae]